MTLPRLRQHARAFAMRVGVVVAALCLVAAVVRGGTRFFYCPISHTSFEAPPCEVVHPTPDTDDPVLRDSDCCEEKWRAVAPASSMPDWHGPPVATAALVAVQPRPRFDHALASSLAVPFEHARAARAPPPSALERQSMLMVFHL